MRCLRPLSQQPLEDAEVHAVAFRHSADVVAQGIIEMTVALTMSAVIRELTEVIAKTAEKLPAHRLCPFLPISITHYVGLSKHSTLTPPPARQPSARRRRPRHTPPCTRRGNTPREEQAIPCMRVRRCCGRRKDANSSSRLRRQKPLRHRISVPARTSASAKVLRRRLCSWKMKAPMKNVIATEKRRRSEPTEMRHAGSESARK